MPTLTHEFGSKKQIFALLNYQDTQTNSGTPLIRTPLGTMNGVLIMGVSYSRGENTIHLCVWSLDLARYPD